MLEIEKLINEIMRIFLSVAVFLSSCERNHCERGEMGKFNNEYTSTITGTNNNPT
jgi:hypothetical protein